LVRDCRSACSEERALEDEGDAGIWLKPFNSGEQNRANEGDGRNVRKS
jgi:hypothetical protein